jgi:cardiolipin synthase
MKSTAAADYQWLTTGEEALGQMLVAIENATKSVRLEMYIFDSSETGLQFRQALIDACQRGVRVSVLVDGLGSATLPESFWQTLRDSGGEFRWFNPIILHRMSIRDHRKIVVCDDELAFIGGFNVASEYWGDGITKGWCDLGLRIRGPLVAELSAAFDDMFSCADFKHQPFARLRKSFRQKTIAMPEAKLLLGGPGRNNPLKRALRADLKKAQAVRIVSPYFLPPWKIRRELMRLARKGATVTLILPGKTDVPMMRMAAESFYRRLLSSGITIHEYQPQILHAKLFLIDAVAYVGSANLDGRGLNINYELMVRLTNPQLTSQGRQIFDAILANCLQIDEEKWRHARGFLDRIKGRLAYFLLARIDPFIAEQQLRLWRNSLKK